MNTITTTKGDGVSFKTLDRHPKVEAYDCHGMEAGRVMVVLVPGFAWYDAAENIGDDPEGRFACHTRGCDSVSEAVAQMKFAEPCKCGRCVPEQGMAKLPNEFTGCEVYRGWTIALANSRYSIWNAAGSCRGGLAASRADARRMIDQQIEDAS